MFIQTESTPNPETIKFIPGQPVLGKGSVEFKSIDESQRSPLAKQLFAIQGVSSVFLAGDFVSVTKAQEKPWEILKPRIMAAIMDHYMSGMPVLEEGSSHSQSGETDMSLASEIDKQIIELIDTRVRPAVAADGGDIVFDRFEEGVVYLHMRGACSGCPSSTATLKAGIENMLKHFIPEVSEVRPVQG